MIKCLNIIPSCLSGSDFYFFSTLKSNIKSYFSIASFCIFILSLDNIYTANSYIWSVSMLHCDDIVTFVNCKSSMVTNLSMYLECYLTACFHRKLKNVIYCLFPFKFPVETEANRIIGDQKNVLPLPPFGGGYCRFNPFKICVEKCRAITCWAEVGVTVCNL